MKTKIRSPFGLAMLTVIGVIAAMFAVGVVVALSGSGGENRSITGAAMGADAPTETPAPTGTQVPDIQLIILPVAPLGGTQEEPSIVPTATPGPVPTPTTVPATPTPLPTYTPYPTYTPGPTAVPNPEPTPIPIPTATPVPIFDDHGDNVFSATITELNPDFDWFAKSSVLQILGELETPDDVDYFSFEAYGGEERFVFSPRFLPLATDLGGGIPKIALYGASWVTPLASIATFTETLSYTPGSPGIIYLAVSNSNPRYTGKYRVIVDRGATSARPNFAKPLEPLLPAGTPTPTPTATLTPVLFPTAVPTPVATPAFTLSTTTATVSESGTTATFTAVLGAQPSSDVVLSVTSADTGETTASASTLTFTNGNWDTAQTVTVTGIDDALVDGGQTTAVTVSVVDASSADAYDSLADQAVTVTTSDNDVAAFTLSTTTATVSESGTTATFTAVLGAQPSSDVVLSITSADTGETTVSASTLTFTNANWDTAQTVTVTGIDDDVVDGDETTAVTIAVDDANSDDAYDSVADQTVTVTTSDNDTAAPYATFVSKWGTEGTGDGQFKNPRGVAVASDGSVYVADGNNHRIQKFTSAGVLVSQWGTNGTGNGKFKTPWGIAVAPDGSVYVSETGNDRIQRFTSAGVFVSKWGSNGTGNGKFKNPKGIAVAPDGSVYVSETGDNDRMQKFSVGP